LKFSSRFVRIFSILFVQKIGKNFSPLSRKKLTLVTFEFNPESESMLLLINEMDLIESGFGMIVVY